MPAYTLQKDPTTGRLKSTLASPASYADIDDYPVFTTTPDPPSKASSSGDMSHPSQLATITDNGPQTRGSRLPLFSQVRSMLHKPPPGKNPKWDRYTGELSEQGVPAHVKPSSYVPPYEARRKSPERPSKSRKGQSPQRRLNAVREQSPVSMLIDEELLRGTPPPDHGQSPSPVSPVSPIDPDLRRIPLQDADRDMVPKPLSANVRQSQTVPTLGTPQPPIHRKPAPRTPSATENIPPSPPSPEQRTPSQFSDFDSGILSEADAERQLTSRMSWTTVAPSVAPGRASTDTTTTTAGMAGRMSKPPSIYPIYQGDSDSEPHSRFSWSTTNTNMTGHARPESPPPMPPAIPEKYIEQSSAPPVQSILSRKRPVQPRDREEQTPPPRKSSMPATHLETASTKEAVTPISINTKSLYPPFSRGSSATPTSAKSNKSGKALPPPPMLSPANNLTHLETLEGELKDLEFQRRNVERAITSLEKIEKASPLEVDFAQVRDAKKKLAEHRKRLDEVKLEEREKGITISRVRRKEGGEEGLWVRRVTG